ncbi:MAG: isocitrate lyase/phosphoenolpyruvate mutase family protein [Geminicoccaceae bacterium]
MATRETKYETFRSLHTSGDIFILPNAWDAGSARLLASRGFAALATTSAGYAFSVGKRDSFAGLTRAEILANARMIVDATDLPVSADLEDGFGADPQCCHDTVVAACDAGLVGGTIEDATGDPERPIHDFGLAVERIRGAVDAARGRSFMLTARSENYLWGRPDLGDTICRLQAFEEAGADVLYAPGLPDLAAIETVCREVSAPVNVVMGLTGLPLSVSQLRTPASAASVSAARSRVRPSALSCARQTR